MLIQAAHGEMHTKRVILQITDNINSLDTYAKAVDNRLNEIRDGTQNRYELTFVDLSARMHELERLVSEMRGMAAPGVNAVGSPER